MTENICDAEAVGIVTIDWNKRSITMDGIGGDDQMTPVEVNARLAQPKEPGVKVYAMVLWDTGSDGHRTLYQLCFYGANEIEVDDETGDPNDTEADDETDDSETDETGDETGDSEDPTG